MIREELGKLCKNGTIREIINNVSREESEDDLNDLEQDIYDEDALVGT